MAAAEGPWSPGLSSTIPDRLMPRVTLYDPQNSTVGWDEARGLSEVTGLSQQLLATFRPERLALHHVLIRVMGELYVPDGPIYADLGINLRRMVSEIYLHHVVPSLEHIAADHGQLCREAEAIIMGELSDAVLAKPPASAPLRGFLGRRIRNRPAGPVSSRDERAFDYVDRWSGGGAADDLHSQCRGALSRTIGAILSRRGGLLVDQGIIVRVATNLVANSAGSELVGRLVAPLFNQGVEALGYRRLPPQADPVVLNAKGASAAGKSSIRSEQRQIATRLRTRLAGFRDHQPRLLAQATDRIFKPRRGLQVRRHADRARTRRSLTRSSVGCWRTTRRRVTFPTCWLIAFAPAASSRIRSTPPQASYLPTSVRGSTCSFL